MVTPQQINLPAGPLASAMSPTIMIRANGTNTMSLSEAVLEGAGAGAGEAPQVRVQEIQPGRVFNLTVNFPAGFQLKADQKVEVKVKSNHPKFPVITVPVFQPPAPAAVAAQSDSSTARVLPTRPAT